MEKNEKELPSFILKPTDSKLRREYLADTSQGSGDFNRAMKITGNLDDCCTLERFQKIMEENKDFDINSSGRVGWTVFGIAITKRCLPVIREILKIDPKIVSKTFLSKKSYMSYAANHGLEIFNFYWKAKEM